MFVLASLVGSQKCSLQQPVLKDVTNGNNLGFKHCSKLAFFGDGSVLLLAAVLLYCLSLTSTSLASLFF